MRIQYKVASCFLAVIVGLPWAFAQESAPGPESHPPAAPGGWAASHRMGPGQMERRGGWKAGENRRDFGRFRGMREERWRRSEFGLARMLSNPALREKLGISAEQVAQIRAQTFDFRKAQIRGRADLQVKRLELSELLSAADPDRAAIDKKLEEISAAQLAQRKSEVDYRLTMRNTLTSEQRQKLQQMRQEFRHRGPEGRGRQGPRAHTPPPKPQGE